MAFFFFFKQKTAYEISTRDWSSDVCSSDLDEVVKQLLDHLVDLEFKKAGAAAASEPMKSEITKQKQAVSEAKAGEFVEVCTKKTAKSRVECAIGAGDLDAVARCDDVK